MKKLLPLFAAVFFAACGSGNTDSLNVPENDSEDVFAEDLSAYTCPLEGYKCVWHEEFDGKDLNKNKWKAEVWPSRRVNNELQEYVDCVTPGGKKTIDVSDGTLKITALEENGNIYSGRIYGNVDTGWKYAYVEARLKLPKGKGTWPAFWMMPVDSSDGWPLCGEIDIMEEVGYDPDVIVGTIHCDAYNHTKGTQKTATMPLEGAEGEFHTYALEWTADYIKTYADGKEILNFPNDNRKEKVTWPFDKPFYVILNLAWGGDWGGSQGVDNTALPATYEVDYVRVFQKNFATSSRALRSGR